MGVHLMGMVCLEAFRFFNVGFLAPPLCFLNHPAYYAATEGPIVIVNATNIGSDAIIVSTSDVRAVALPDHFLSRSGG
jgi:hypothetical protein